MKNKKAIVCLSFDDGRKDFFDNAFPILKKYNFCFSLHKPSIFVLEKITNIYYYILIIPNIAYIPIFLKVGIKIWRKRKEYGTLWAGFTAERCCRT